MKRFIILLVTVSMLLVPYVVSGQGRIIEENVIVDAVQLYDNGQYPEAESLLAKLVEAIPSSDAGWYYLGLTQARLQKNEKAFQSLEKAVSLDPDNYWYTVTLAEYYQQSRTNIARCLELYEEALRRHPDKTDIHYSLLSIYVGTRQYDKALEALNSIETYMGTSERIASIRYEICRMMGDEQKGIAALEEFNSKYSSPEISSLLGDYYLEERMDSLALACYEEALYLDSSYTPAIFGKSEVYRKQRNYPAYFAIIEDVMGNVNTDITVKTSYLSNMIRQLEPSFIRNHLTEIDRLHEKGMEVHPSDSLMLSTAGIYYSTTGRRDKGKQILRKCADLYPESIDQNVTFMQLLYLGEEWEELRGRSDTLLRRFPDKTVFYELNNTARYNLQDYAGIIHNAEQQIKMHPADTSVTIPAYAMIGDMYHSLGDEKKSFSAYEKVLKLSPDYLPVLNNYAYYLSMSGKKLRKAYTMSQKTIAAEPDNPTYLDTFGWILHLQGKDLESKAMFKHAMLYGGKDSAVILDHYAEVLYSLKEYDLAKVYWNQAISKNKGELKNLEKKVQHRLKNIP